MHCNATNRHAAQCGGVFALKKKAYPLPRCYAEADMQLLLQVVSYRESLLRGINAGRYWITPQATRPPALPVGSVL